MTALIEHARSSIMYEKQLLRELDALRVDVDSAAKKVLPPANGIPKPKIIPPLEDFSERPIPPPSAPAVNGFHRSPVPPHQAIPHTAVPSSQRFHVPRLPGLPPEPVSATSTISHESSEGPSSPAPSATQVKQPLSLPSGPSNGIANVTLPPKGRFVDGTKSMIVQSTSSHSQGAPVASSSTSALPNATAPTQDPLQNRSLQSAQAPSSVDPLGALTNTTQAKLRPAISIDPLANVKSNQMSSSMRLPPHRPRLDPREAASKLANMF